MSFKYTPTTLRKLEGLFEEAAYTVRYERGTFQSGYCLLEDRKVVVVNRFLQIEGRINALVEMLPQITIDEETLSGEMLPFYRQMKAAPRPANTEAATLETPKEVLS
jgi:hypothetical protein